VLNTPMWLAKTSHRMLSMTFGTSRLLAAGICFICTVSSSLCSLPC